jgi:hypothetical protein
MPEGSNRLRLEKTAALIALVVGVAAGSYGVASAASGSNSSQNAAATTTTPAAPSQAPPGATPGNPWGHQRSDETLLTGDTATKVRDAALAKLGSGATIIRVETDAEGHAAYEAHATKADGTPATVYVNESFDVVSVESR